MIGWLERGGDEVKVGLVVDGVVDDNVEVDGDAMVVEAGMCNVVEVNGDVVGMAGEVEMDDGVVGMVNEDVESDVDFKVDVVVVGLVNVAVVAVDIGDVVVGISDSVEEIDVVEKGGGIVFEVDEIVVVDVVNVVVEVDNVAVEVSKVVVGNAVSEVVVVVVEVEKGDTTSATLLTRMLASTVLLDAD